MGRCWCVAKTDTSVFQLSAISRTSQKCSRYLRLSTDTRNVKGALDLGVASTSLFIGDEDYASDRAFGNPGSPLSAATAKDPGVRFRKSDCR